MIAPTREASCYHVMSIASRVLSGIILTRMLDPVKEKLLDEQAWFRRGHSCYGQVTKLRIIKEQTLRWNTEHIVFMVSMVFVDFERAFDSIDHEMLWKILRHYGIPAKIVTMIQVLYDCFQAWVFHEGRMTEPLEMKTKVRQRCILSPILFLVSLDWVTMQAYGENKTGV